MNTIRFYLALILGLLAVFFSGCKKKYYPTPNDTIMGSGYSERSDYVEGSQAYYHSLSQEGLTPRQETPATADLAAHSLEHALVSIYFQFDNFSISTHERPKLVEAFQKLEESGNTSFLIVGRCDYHGTAEYNMALGEKRANSVKDYLSKLGADTSRLQTLSRGDLDASARNGTPAETAQDRRVDIVLMQ